MGTFLKSNLFVRAIPTLSGLCAVALLTILWLSGGEGLYMRLLNLLGMTPFTFAFLDGHGALAAWDCSRMGIDVILSDPCDVHHRGYNYPPFWMTINWIPLTRENLVGFGFSLAIAFLVSLAFLPPPLAKNETFLRLGALFSTMVVLGIERANPDIMIFVFVIMMLFLLHGSLLARVCGYGLAFLGGAIKYYPFILLSLMIRERVRTMIPLALIGFAAIVGFFLIYLEEIRIGFPHIMSSGPFDQMFGAKNFPKGVFLATRVLFFESAGKTVHSLDIIMAGLVSFLATVVLIMRIARSMVGLWRTSDIPGALARLDSHRSLALFAGILLIAGCFFTGQSYGYRGVFLFLVIPGLFALWQREMPSTLGNAARVASLGLMPLMWAEAIRLWVYLFVVTLNVQGEFKTLGHVLNFLVWLTREIAWWFFAGFLVTLLLGFLINSPLFEALRRYLPKRLTA